MSETRSRSMNASLREGSTDSSLKKRRPDTEGTPGNTAATLRRREHLLPENGFSYGGDGCGDGTHP